MANLTLGVRIVNVPETMPHQDRATEILRLPEFVRVDMTTAAGVSLLNYGSETPPVDLAGLPWIKLNPDGSPAGIFVFHNGTWTRATPNTLDSEVGDLTLLGGTVTFTLNTAAGVAQIHDVVTFDPHYVATPTVFTEVVGGTLFDHATDYAKWTYKTVATLENLKIHTRSETNLAAGPLTVIFNWMALGVRDE